jgi:drug/metabolite transporter (DMT)-like permease
VLIRRLRNDEHPSTIYASQAVCSLALATPLAGGLAVLPPLAWAGLAVAGVIVAGGQLVMTRAYQIVPVGKGSAMQMTLPLATSVGGFVFFGETFEPMEIAGAMVTLFATWRVVVSR